MGGGAVGYAATGTMDGTLMGASMGQAIGGAFGNFAVACFTAGTPLVVDMEGNSRPIDEIEVGDFVLARSEFDPDGPLELKRERPLNRILTSLEVIWFSCGSLAVVFLPLFDDALLGVLHQSPICSLGAPPTNGLVAFHLARYSLPIRPNSIARMLRPFDSTEVSQSHLSAN